MPSKNPGKAARPVPRETEARIVASSRVSLEASFESPLPPPELVRQYEELIPGCAARMFEMAQAEAAHRRSQEELILKAEIREIRLGQCFAFLITVAFLLAGVLLAHWNQPWPGTVFGSVGVGSIVTMFILGRNRDGSGGQDAPGPSDDRARTD